MRNNKKGKKKIVVIIVIIIAILVALFAGYYALKVHETKSKEEVLESGVIIRPAESSESADSEQDTKADSNKDDSKNDSSKTDADSEDAVVLENQGDLEIIVPEGMDSDGL